MNSGPLQETGPHHARRNLLFLGQNFPFPPDSGAKIRSFHLLRVLASEFDVTVLCFSPEHSAPGKKVTVPAPLSDLLSDLSVFPIRQRRSRFRWAWDHVRSVFARRVYTAFLYESREFEARLLEVLGERDFHVVHLDSLDLSRYLPAISHLPVVCGHHNVESSLLRRRAAAEGSLLRGSYLRFQGHLMEKEERLWSRRAALNITCSSEDAELLRRTAPESRILVVPNGVDTEALKPSPSPGSEILFLGGYDWFPNRDAMHFFSTDILPSIRDQAGDVPVTWVGKAPERVREEFRARYGIHLTDRVEDIRPYLAAAACVIVPLRVGGGTRLKILDSWSMGRAVVSTSIGCEGLRAKDGQNILIRDDPTAFASAVLEVLKDTGLRTGLGEEGRKTAVNYYDWNVVGRLLLEGYQGVLEEP
jgi:glycosyltransferase involved in cell wall biosynthesis